MRRLLQLPLRIPIFVIALVAAAVLVVRACGPGAGAIGERNHELLAEIPVYPGGAVIRMVDVDRETSLLPGFSGWTSGRETHRADRLGAGAIQDRVLGFYTGHLSDWTQVVIQADCIRHYRRGKASLILTACGSPQVSEVRLQINSNEYD